MPNRRTGVDNGVDPSTSGLSEWSFHHVDSELLFSAVRGGSASGTDDARSGPRGDDTTSDGDTPLGTFDCFGCGRQCDVVWLVFGLCLHG